MIDSNIEIITRTKKNDTNNHLSTLNQANTLIICDKYWNRKRRENNSKTFNDLLIPVTNVENQKIIGSFSLKTPNENMEEWNTLRIKLNALESENSLLFDQILRQQFAKLSYEENIAKYHGTKKHVRKQKKKAIPHSINSPKSHKIGKPRGAKGAGRMKPTDIHQTIIVPVDYCPHCKKDLFPKKQRHHHFHIVTELVESMDFLNVFKIQQLSNIKYDVQQCRCPFCKRTIVAQMGEQKYRRIGINLVRYIICMRIILPNSYNNIIQQLNLQFGKHFDISKSGVCNFIKEFDEKIGGLNKQLQDMVKKAQIIHADETGCPMNGKNEWIWVCCNQIVNYFWHHPHRSFEAISDVLDVFDGILCSDFYSAYSKFNQSKQKCIAHLLSTIIENIVKLKDVTVELEKSLESRTDIIQTSQIDFNKTEVQDLSISFRKQSKKQASIRKTKKKSSSMAISKKASKTQSQEGISKAKRQKIESTIKNNHANLAILRDMAEFWRNVFKDTDIGWRTPMKDRISEKMAIQRLNHKLVEWERDSSKIKVEQSVSTLIKRMHKYELELFTYLNVEGMPADNNAAERALRPLAIQRKMSGNFISPIHMAHYLTYQSLYQTCKLHGKDFQLALKLFLSSKDFDLEAFLM